MASLVAQRVKRLSTMQETWVRSLGWEDPLEKENYPSFLVVIIDISVVSVSNVVSTCFSSFSPLLLLDMFILNFS